MAQQVKIKKTVEEGEFWHVRFRQPGRFDMIRTPAWAADVAESTSKGARVRMGRTEAGNWLVQSVLLRPAGVDGKSHAEKLAREIQREIDD